MCGGGGTGRPWLADTTDAIVSRLPTVLATIAATVFLVLLLLTRSLLLPLKALLLNTLTLAATLGTVVHLFQEGHAPWLTGDIAVTHITDLTVLCLMFSIAFGLSMDYEIFLMARIVEEHRRTGDTRTATAAGIEHTARVFTAAALIVAVVMGALAASGLLALKMIGTGLAVAVLLDAPLVRAVLVPAFIRLAGRANWWLPRVTARRGRCRCAGRLRVRGGRAGPGRGPSAPYGERRAAVAQPPSEDLGPLGDDVEVVEQGRAAQGDATRDQRHGVDADGRGVTELPEQGPDQRDARPAPGHGHRRLQLVAAHLVDDHVDTVGRRRAQPGELPGQRTDRPGRARHEHGVARAHFTGAYDTHVRRGALRQMSGRIGQRVEVQALDGLDVQRGVLPPASRHRDGPDLPLPSAYVNSPATLGHSAHRYGHQVPSTPPPPATLVNSPTPMPGVPLERVLASVLRPGRRSL